MTLAVVVLGPALGSGVVLAYDLAWSPDPRLTPFALGLDTPAPRAVPSDAVGVLIGQVLGASVAQKVVLVSILVLAALGARALLLHLRPCAGLLGATTALVVGVWNPFVAERLVIGQWTVLLGYAVLPWAVRAALRVRAGSGSVIAVCGWVCLAGLGGANPLVMVAPVVALLLVLPTPRWGALVTTTLTALGVGAAWWLPAVARGAEAASSGFKAFGARADGPLGLPVSLLGGGGLWNPAAHPPERGSAVVALMWAALLVGGVVALATVRSRLRTTAVPLVVVAVVGLVLAAVSGWASAAPVWTLLGSVPGGGLLRDGQKLLALWVVVGAVGAGVAADVLSRRGGAAMAPAAVLVVLAPLMLPSLAWGVHGRLRAVTVPSDLRIAAAALSRADAGDVGLLPWRQYRRYTWNGDRVSLSLVPRMVDQVVRYDDSLPLSSGRVPGEDPRAEAVTAAIASGASEYDAVSAAGVRYVVVERQTGLKDLGVPDGAGRVLVRGDHILVLDRGPGAGRQPDTPAYGPRPSVAGWAVTSVTMMLVLVAGCRRAVGRKRVTAKASC